MSEPNEQPAVNMERTRSSAGDLGVVRVNRDTMRRIQVSPADLARIAEVGQTVVRAQLDGEGVRVTIRGNAHFGAANPLERDGMDGQPTEARSMAGFTVEADDDDAKAVADLLSQIGEKYKRRAMMGAMKSAMMAMDPMTLPEIDGE